MRKFEFTDELVKLAYNDYRSDNPSIVDAVKNMSYSVALSYLMWNMDDGRFTTFGFDRMVDLAKMLFDSLEYDGAVDKVVQLLIDDFPLEFNNHIYTKEES